MKKTILFSMGMLCLITFARGQSGYLVDNAVVGGGPNQHNYVGASWVNNSTTVTFYNKTMSYSNVAGAYVTITFDGKQVLWYTEKKNTHGIAAVSIDGGAETMI